MVVYLSSSDLVTGSNTILRGNIDNGVGFVLDLKEPPKGTEAAIKISASGDQGAATSLWKTDKTGASLNSNIINIPVPPVTTSTIQTKLNLAHYRQPH